MLNKGPKSLSQLLGERDTAVERLAAEADARLALTDLLRAQLDDELAAQLQASNLREDGTLVLLVSSPAWASRLRFEADRLLSSCRGRHPAAARVRVRVAHPD